ncbi:GNAT family N-acetyltransferase [Paraflavitalea speifideaquila]|uniref:GNAT family N-acetyltransferase n=1 Tax=Paraflavitalea speifideaquila TaxID=3076558 RepID=UPI0028EF473A|nr:GNAT family N-acetyltransferase [Paraflavitalea speifideiaquila]
MGHLLSGSSPLTASLGVFGTHVTAVITSLFLKAIPAKFKLIDLLLNKANFLPATRAQSMRSNYVLDLHNPYVEIYDQYRNNVRRNTKKAGQLNCRYVTGIPVEEVITLAHWQMQQQVTNVGEEDYAHFKDLYQLLASKEMAQTSGVYTVNGELVASCVWFYSHGRAYYILVGNHPNGKTLGLLIILLIGLLRLMRVGR